MWLKFQWKVVKLTPRAPALYWENLTYHTLCLFLVIKRRRHIWTTVKVCESCGDRMRLATGASITAGSTSACIGSALT